MAFPFESPGRLEERIAANMADESDDLSLGVGRRAPSFASISISTDENSLSRPGPEESFQASQGGQSGRWRYNEGQQAANATGRSNSSATAVLAARDTNSSAGRVTLANAVKRQSQSSFSLASNVSTSSSGSASNVRVRSPPLTSTPHPSTQGQRTFTSSNSSTHLDASRRNTASRKSISSNSRSSLGWKSANDGLNQASLQSISGPSLVSQVQKDDEKSDGDNDDSGNLSGGLDEEAQEGEEQKSGAGTGTMHTSDFASDSKHEEAERGAASISEVQGARGGEDEAHSSSTRDVLSSPAASRYARRVEIEAASSPVHRGSATEGTSTPRASKLDQERMKAYLINSVKAVNPLREAHLHNLTPRRRRMGGEATPRRPPLSAGLSRLQLADDTNGENEGESFVSDASSTRDLTMPARLAMRPNTSFPGVGAGDGSAPSNARVDPTRLQGYLHKINIQLESENVSLKEEKDALTRQFNRALNDCERLKKQVEVGKDGVREGQGARVSQGTMTTNDEVEELKREIETLRIGQEELNDMLDERDAELEGAERKLQEMASPTGVYERLRELEEELIEEKEASDRQRKRFEESMREAMEEADRVQSTAEQKLTAERDEAWAELEKTKLTSARTRESTGEEMDVIAGYEERDRRNQDALRQADEARMELQQQLEGEAAAFDELELELGNAREDLMRAEEELAGVREELMRAEEELGETKDLAMDLRIVAEEKESSNIKLSMQLRQAKESTELKQLKEKVVLLEAQLEGARQDSIRQSTPLPKNVAHLRKPVETPRSPAELSSASWLNNESTLGDRSVLRNIHELRARVDDAHAQTDQKLAGLGATQLAQRMVEMQGQMEVRDEEVRMLKEREERWRKRVERIRCSHCKAKMKKVELDQSFASRASMSIATTEGDASMLAKSTRSSHHKEQIVAEIAEQLNELKARWAVDRAKLEGDREAMGVEKAQWTEEKAQLQTENQRLKVERERRSREAKENARRMQESTLKDLSRARRIIGEFEREFKDDCARFQQAMQSSKGLDEDGVEVERELSQTREKLEEVEGELKAKVEVFERLENELFEKSQMDRNLPLHVQLLEMEVQKFSLEVASLRNERNMILEQRQILYHRHRHNQEEYMNMYEELKGAREAISAHQVQLDEQIETIERLHGTLTAQNRDLEALHDDRDRLQTQRTDILTDVASLETDLRRVREESMRFGLDLEKMRAEQEWTRRKETGKAAPGSSGKAMEEEQLAAWEQREAENVRRHHVQCQGLLLQVRYEKAKFMRESDLRSDLIQQKTYLLSVLGGMDIVDATTEQFLADLRVRRRGASDVRGSQRSTPTAGVNRFRVAAWTVVGVCRARIMARHWKETSEIKRVLRDAHKASKLLRQG